MDTTVTLFNEFEVAITGLPESAEQYDEMAGRAGACNERAIAHYIAHTHNTKLRAAVVKALEEATGFKRAAKVDGNKTVYTETEGQYVGRLAKHLAGEGESLSDYADQVAAVAASVKVDLKPAVRGTGATATPPKKWLAWVAQLVAEGQLEAFADKHGIIVSDPDADDLDTDDEGNEIGRLVAGVSNETAIAVANKVREVVSEKEKQALEAARQSLLG